MFPDLLGLGLTEPRRFEEVSAGGDRCTCFLCQLACKSSRCTCSCIHHHRTPSEDTVPGRLSHHPACQCCCQHRHPQPSQAVQLLDGPPTLRQILIPLLPPHPLSASCPADTRHQTKGHGQTDHTLLLCHTLLLSLLLLLTACSSCWRGCWCAAKGRGMCVCSGSGAQPSKAGKQVVRAGGWKGPVTPALAGTRHTNNACDKHGQQQQQDGRFKSRNKPAARCCMPALLPFPPCTSCTANLQPLRTAVKHTHKQTPQRASPALILQEVILVSCLLRLLLLLLLTFPC